MEDNQYIEEHLELCRLCCSRTVLTPGKSEKRRMPVIPVVAKKRFSGDSPSASRPSLQVALEKTFEESGARRSGRDRRNAPVFQRDTSN